MERRTATDHRFGIVRRKRLRFPAPSPNCVSRTSKTTKRKRPMCAQTRCSSGRRCCSNGRITFPASAARLFVSPDTFRYYRNLGGWPPDRSFSQPENHEMKKSILVIIATAGLTLSSVSEASENVLVNLSPSCEEMASITVITTPVLNRSLLYGGFYVSGYVRENASSFSFEVYNASGVRLLRVFPILRDETLFSADEAVYDRNIIPDLEKEWNIKNCTLVPATPETRDVEKCAMEAARTDREYIDAEAKLRALETEILLGRASRLSLDLTMRGLELEMQSVIADHERRCRNQ